jgi:negative regulator of flagellin synthesis FlgM
MAEIRRTPAATGANGVVYDFAKRARIETNETDSDAPADRVGITESARELSRAHSAVEAAPDVRTERVRALKQQIQNGTYQPDPKEIAKRILDKGF